MNVAAALLIVETAKTTFDIEVALQSCPHLKVISYVVVVLMSMISSVEIGD